MLHDDLDLRDQPDVGVHPLRSFLAWFRPSLLIGVVLGLVGVEVGLRVLELRTGDLGVVTSTTSTHADRLARADHDLVLVGSSSTGAAFWAPQLEDATACDAYVAWLPSPTMHDLRRFVSDVVLAADPPERLVLGLTMRELVPPAPDQPSEVAELLEPEGWLERHLHLVRVRPTMQDPVQFGLALQGGLIEELSPDGNQLIMRDRRLADESEQHVRQERDKMAAFELRPDAVDAFAGLLADVSSSGTQLTVVNLPVTDQFVRFAPSAARDEAAYLDTVQRVTAAAGVPFVDLAGAPLDEDVHFADVNHLNAAGSEVVSAALSTRLGRCDG